MSTPMIYRMEKSDENIVAMMTANNGQPAEQGGAKASLEGKPQTSDHIPCAAMGVCAPEEGGLRENLPLCRRCDQREGEPYVSKRMFEFCTGARGNPGPRRDKGIGIRWRLQGA